MSQINCPADRCRPLGLGTEPVVGIALQPVREQQHDGPPGQHAPRPAPVEFAKRRADARATVPVLDHCTQVRETAIDVFACQLPADMAEPRPEDERRHAPVAIAQTVGEMQEHARVFRHRTRNIAEYDDRGYDTPTTTPRKPDDFAPGPVGMPQRRGEIDLFAHGATLITS